MNIFINKYKMNPLSQTTNQRARLRIDRSKKQKTLQLKNCVNQINIGPFDIETIITGDYNLKTRKGYLECLIKLTRPYELKQKTMLLDSRITLKYKSSIQSLLDVFNLEINDSLRKFFETQLEFIFQFDPIIKDWQIEGSLENNSLSFKICEKQFSVKKIGYEMCGIKKSIQTKKFFIFFEICGYPLKLAHSINGEFLFEAYLEKIPIGKIISGFADKDQDNLDVTKAFDEWELLENEFKFKNFSHFSIQSLCKYGECLISIEKGKFYIKFRIHKDFKFENIGKSLIFLDVLHLNNIGFILSNRDDKDRGLSIEGFLPIIQNPILEELSKIFNMPNLLDGIPFSLTISSWKNISARISFLKDAKISDVIKAKLIELRIEPKLSGPEFSLDGEIEAKICEEKFIFRLSCVVGASPRVEASFLGTWNEPFGLKNSYIKDLLLSVGYMNFAIAGKLKLSDLETEVAIVVDSINPSRNMLYFELNKFYLNRLLTSFSINIPTEIANVLKEIEIHKMMSYLVPVGGVTLGSKFYDEGMQAELDGEIFQIKAKFKLKYLKNYLEVFGEIDPIIIPNILTLKSSQNNSKGPSLDVKLGLCLDSHFKIDGFLNIMGLFELEVYASADLQGIIFYARRSIKIFGMDFIENSFLLKAGLMRQTDGFIIQAKLKMDTDCFRILGEEIRKLAEKSAQPFKIAQEELQKAQKLLKEKQRELEKEKEIQKNKLEKSKEKMEQAIKSHREQAWKVFEDQKNAAEKRLNEDRAIAHRNMTEAKNHARRTLEQENIRAKKQLEDEEKRASNELNQRRAELKRTMEGERAKLNGLNDSIRWHEGRPWYEFHVKAALAALYTARASAYAGIAVAEESSKLALNVADNTYWAMLESSKGIYWSMLETAKGTCQASIDAADSTHWLALEAAKATHREAMNAAQNTYDSALAAAALVGQSAYDAYINTVDLAFNTAKAALDQALLVLDGAQITLKEAEKTCKLALNFLAQLAEGLASVMNIRLIFFEFDLNKRIIRQTVDITILKRDIKIDLQFTLENIGDFIKKLAENLWANFSSLT